MGEKGGDEKNAGKKELVNEDTLTYNNVKIDFIPYAFAWIGDG